MIEAETVVSRSLNELYEIIGWCTKQFGPRATELDNVGEEYTWAYRSELNIFETSFHFAHAEDCTFFILRWT